MTLFEILTEDVGDITSFFGWVSGFFLCVCGCSWFTGASDFNSSPSVCGVASFLVSCWDGEFN